MPVKSKSQVRALFAKARRGEIAESKVKEMVHATPSIKSLPERVKKPRKKKG